MMQTVKAHIPPSKWSRPQITRPDTRAIVMHWTGKAQQRALGVLKYWAERDGTYGSAHFVIDHDGKVYEAMPAQELAYHCGSKTYTALAQDSPLALTEHDQSPNHHTIGIEMCVLDYEGTYSTRCYNAAIQLVANLCENFGLNPFHEVITHQMVVGWKECPKAWVKHPEYFEMFRHMVAEAQ